MAVQFYIFSPAGTRSARRDGCVDARLRRALSPLLRLAVILASHINLLRTNCFLIDREQATSKVIVDYLQLESCSSILQ